MHYILLEEDSNSSIEAKKRLNPSIKEVLKWIDVGIIYPILDNARVSLVREISRKGSMTIIQNEKNELFRTRTVTRGRICKEYRKLNKVIRKGHFSLPFID